MVKTGGNPQALQWLAAKIGIGEEEKVVSKAAEYERRLQMKATSSSSVSDTAKTVICLNLAATAYGVEFDMKTAIKYSGVKPSAYTNSKKMLENLLKLTVDKLTVALLCAQLHCDAVQETAQKILDYYQKSTKMEIDLNLPQYVCMAVHQACRINKVKVVKSKLLEKSRLKPGQWSKMEAEWTKVVDPKFAVVKKKKGRQSKVLDEEPVEKVEIDQPKKTEEEDEEPTIEPYEVWKARILAAAYATVKQLKEQQLDGIQPKADDREQVTNNVNKKTDSKRNKSNLCKTPEKNGVTERDNRKLVENNIPNKRRNTHKITEEMLDVSFLDISSDDSKLDETTDKSIKLDNRGKLVKDNLVDKSSNKVEKPDKAVKAGKEKILDKSNKELSGKPKKVDKTVDKEKHGGKKVVMSYDNWLPSPRRSLRLTPTKEIKAVDKEKTLEKSIKELSKLLISGDLVDNSEKLSKKPNLVDKTVDKEIHGCKKVVLSYDSSLPSPRRSPRLTPTKELSRTRRTPQKYEPYQSPVKGKEVRLLFPSE